MINKEKLPNPLKAVFFDMDGVLYDSMKNHASTWVASFKQAGIDFPAYDAYLNEGRTGPGTIELAFKQYGNREATEEDIQNIYNHKTSLMLEAPEALILPGMQEIIRQTMDAGIKVMVVTGSKQPSLIERLQKDFGIPDGAIVSGFDVKRGKPDPEPYLIALEKTGCKCDEALVIENAPMGVRSAHAAGIPTLAVNTGILKDNVLSDEGAIKVFPDTLSLFEQWPSIISYK
jgi:HAD superfamily hydrolase (TIGR01509 family)